MFISDIESLKLDQTKTICICDFIMCSVSLHTRYHFDLDTRYGKISHVLNLLKVNGELICVCNKNKYNHRTIQCTEIK